ncbi:MAG: CcmD family protein [Bacteroidetes bacterium]|nr:CcmD family protein [Bacteroidota bacterium]
MLAHDKLYVVLAVVLIIWFGIVILLLRNDARLKAVERTIEERGIRSDDGL